MRAFAHHSVTISMPVSVGQYDWVMSLEVGEHLPQQFERTFIDNLQRHNTKGIILSWALDGQGGHGHFNERPISYIKNLFAQDGYINDIHSETMLRASATLWWFKNTIMVFRRP